MAQQYRIAFIFPAIYMGGSEKVLFNLANAFQREGHCISFFSLKPSSIELPEGLPQPAVPPAYFRYLPKPLQLWQLRRMIEKNERKFGDFDLILSNLHTRKPVIRKNPARLFDYLHLINPTQTPKYLKSLSRYYKGRQVIAVSQGVKDAFLKIPGIQPASVRMIYNGFDFAEIQRQAKAFKPRIEEPYLIHVGRFDPQKRHDLLFDAYRRLKNPPKLVLLVQPTEALHQLIAHYELIDQVILPGLQSNPFPWIKQAKVLILSSDFESFGNVVVEALVCKTPVVSTETIGPPEILTGELSDWLCPLNDPVTLAKKIQEVLDRPYPIKLEQLQDFDMNQVLPQYLSLIKARNPTQNIKIKNPS